MSLNLLLIVMLMETKQAAHGIIGAFCQKVRDGESSHFASQQNYTVRAQSCTVICGIDVVNFCATSRYDQAIRQFVQEQLENASTIVRVVLHSWNSHILWHCALLAERSARE